MTSDFDKVNFNFLHRPQIFPATTKVSANSPFRTANSTQYAHMKFSTGSDNMDFETPQTQRRIKDEMSRSPKGISPTDKRVKYLMKAKASRAEKNNERKSQTRFNFNSSQTQEWAASGTVQPPQTGVRNKINPCDSNEAIRRF